jgi:hypothetical protein
MAIIYRTSGPWGAGLGADLLASQVDNNFYELAQDIATLNAAGRGAGIDYLQVSGNQFWVHLDNHQVIGPYTLPQAQWTFTGTWQANIAYFTNDVFAHNGSIYLVLQPHTSQSVFNPSYMIGGSPVYALMLTQPDLTLPDGGTVGQVLTQGPADSPGDTVWTTLTRNLALYIEGQPTANETVLQYICPEQMTLPAGLAGSEAYASQLPTANAIFGLYKNGTAIGSIEFAISPQEVIFSFSGQVLFNDGDILTIVAPASVDTTLANISITLQALLP